MDVARLQLEALQAQSPPPPLLFFWGHRGKGAAYLSQWYPSAFQVDGIRYATAEHYMMAEKARLFGDEAKVEQILANPDPAAAKKLGRAVRSFDAQRWDESSFSIVLRGNLAKFQQNEAERTFLLSTGDAVLVEASPYDAVWGIGLQRSHPDAAVPARWPGQNRLGFVLMEVRRQLGTRFPEEG